MFNDEETEYPYKCDPTYPEKNCKIMFNIDPISSNYTKGQLSYVNTNCRCSLSSLGGGYCQDVVGTGVYKKYVEQMNYIYKQSSCHTLDRENL